MQRKWLRAAGALLLLCAGSSSLGHDSEVITTRIANFREIGTALKSVNDELKSECPNLARIRESADLIKRRGADIPGWFPVGSEPAPAASQPTWLDRIRTWFGLGSTLALSNDAQTRAKIEVWNEPLAFKEAHRRFMGAATELSDATQAAELKIIATRVQTLGKSCESCHERFREERD